MQTVIEWGPWKDWNPDTALGPPPDAPPGAIVQADVIIRADWVTRTPHPAMIAGFTFEVQNGEAFCLCPPWQHAKDMKSSHLVIRYRVQVTKVIEEAEMTAEA